MAENNNNRLSRRNRISQGKKSVMPGGYISRGNNSQSSGQQRRPLNGEEMRRSGTRSSGNNQRPIGANQRSNSQQRQNPLRQQQMGRPGGGGKGPNPNNKKPNRISNPNTKKIKNPEGNLKVSSGFYLLILIHGIAKKNQHLCRFFFLSIVFYKMFYRRCKIFYYVCSLSFYFLWRTIHTV